MRGRSQAIGAAVITTALPLLNWLGTAIVSLVILRKGASEGLLVLGCAILPLAIATYYVGDPSAIIALIGTALMAYLLRVTVSWEVTLVSVIVIAGVGSLVFEFTAVEIVKAIVEWYRELTSGVDMTFEEAKSMMLGFFAMGQAYAMLALLILARWWQSSLYNPGGFQEEFHQLRLSPVISTPLVLTMFVCFYFSEQLGRWIPLLTVPLILSAVAFVHWAIKFKSLTTGWLVTFYMLVLLLFQLVYPVLAAIALLDSWVNLREKIQSKGD